MLLCLSPHIPEDLEEIADFIAEGNPRQAALWLSKMEARMEAIAQQPRIYQLRPELGKGIRVAVEGNYLIIFRIRGDEIVRIERIVHGSRDLPQITEDFRLA